MAVKKKTTAKKKVSVKQAAKKSASRKKKPVDECTGSCVYINGTLVDSDCSGTETCDCPGVPPSVRDDVQICSCVDAHGIPKARAPKFKRQKRTLFSRHPTTNKRIIHIFLIEI